MSGWGGGSRFGLAKPVDRELAFRWSKLHDPSLQTVYDFEFQVKVLNMSRRHTSASSKGSGATFALECLM